MNLLHRVGTGLLLVSGVFVAEAHAQGPGCTDCGIPVPAIDNGLGPVHRWGPRMKYRSHSHFAAPRAPGFVGPMPLMAPGPRLGRGPLWGGGPMMGLGLADCQCGPVMGPMLPAFSPMMGCPQPCAPAPMMDCAPLIQSAPTMDCAPLPAPVIVPQTTLQPVIETQMTPQQVTTYCDVPKTVMRREAVHVQVPTTTYKQVTVDEGCYQTVWVPKMVTKNVPQTVMQTQMQYRDVATTVTERVPRTTTQWVPRQVVRHVPQTIGVPQCGPVGAPSYPMVTPTEVAPLEVGPTPDYNPQPLVPVPAPMGESAAAPTPVPQTSHLPEWQKVKQRQIEQQNYEYAAPESAVRIPKAAGRFSSSRR